MLGDSVVKHGHSSLPLQTCVYFNWHYTCLFFIINLCLFTYKSVRFYYPANYLGTTLEPPCACRLSVYLSIYFLSLCLPTSAGRMGHCDHIHVPRRRLGAAAAGVQGKQGRPRDTDAHKRTHT